MDIHENYSIIANLLRRMIRTANELAQDSNNYNQTDQFRFTDVQRCLLAVSIFTDACRNGRGLKRSIMHLKRTFDDSFVVKLTLDGYFGKRTTALLNTFFGRNDFDEAR